MNLKLKGNDNDFKAKLINYKDDDGTFKGTTPVGITDNIIVEDLKGLFKKLNANELKIKIEIN